MGYFKRGFLKTAAGEDPQQPTNQETQPQPMPMPQNTDQQAAPIENEKDTVVICVSNCQYSQNPEKKCMLDNIALSQNPQGQFQCGQYTPIQQMVPADPGAQEQQEQPSEAKKQPSPQG